MKKQFLSLVIIGFTACMVAMEPVSASGFFGQASQGTITVQTNDDQVFNVPLELAKQIPLIKGMIEDIGESAIIPLPTIDGATFDWITRTLQMLQDNPASLIKTKEYTTDQLINFANACEYLELENLQNILFQILTIRTLPETSLKNMNDTVLKKFWQQHPAYPYTLNLATLHRELKGLMTGSLLINPTGDLLIISGSYLQKRDRIEIWDLNTKNRLAELHHKNCIGIIMTADGNKLISWGEDKNQEKTIKIWDMHTRKQLLPELHNRTGDSLFISPQGKLILISSRDTVKGTIKIWNLNDLNQKPQILRHKYVSDLTISPDETTLISWLGSESPLANENKKTVKVWDLNTGKERFPEFEDETLRSIIITPDGSKFILDPGKTNAPIKIRDLHTGNQLLPELQTNGSDKIIISPDGNKLISWTFSALPYNVTIWNMNNLNQEPQTLQNKEGYLQQAVVSPDGKKLILCFRTGTIKIWDLYALHQKPKILQHSEPKILQRPDANDIIISSNGTTLVFRTTLFSKHDFGKTSYSWNLIAWDLTVLDELDNLTAQQIAFMIWLYKNKAYKPEASINITTPLQFIYESLPNNIKNNLRNQLPIIQTLESFKSPFVIKHYE